MIAYSGPVRVRMIFQKCGGIFVKFGQMLALRADVLPTPIAYELLNLLEHLPPISTKKIRQTIEKELQAPVEHLFPWFDNTPLAVASFAQVHQAKLPDGRTVIVKVQKPWIDNMVSVDLKILKLLAAVLDAVLGHRPITMREVIKEFSLWTMQELDYIREAETVEQFHACMTLPWVTAPYIMWQYTSKRVLTETYMEGMSLSNHIELPYHADNPLIAKKLLESISDQYFLKGFFHADPHPGNILVDTSTGMLTYIDFGMTGRTTHEHRQAMARFIYHAFRGDYEASIHSFLKLGFSRRLARDRKMLEHDQQFARMFDFTIPVVERLVVEQFSHIMRKWQHAIKDPEAPFHQKSAAAAFLSFLSVASRYRITLDREIILFIKALVAVDAISLQLDPTFNLLETINAIFSKSDYQHLFSTAVELPQELHIFENRVDEERIHQLKDYYTDWMGSLMEMHEKEFNQYI